MTENEKEELRQMIKRIRLEEEEEDIEIGACFQRLAYMLDSCSKYDPRIGGLIGEQQGMLNVLCTDKKEFLDKVDNLMRLEPS